MKSSSNPICFPSLSSPSPPNKSFPPRRSNSFNILRTELADDKDNMRTTTVKTTNTATSSKGTTAKNKSSSLLGLKRWRSKGLDQESEKPKRKLRISDLSQFISSWMVRPLTFFKGNSWVMGGRGLNRDDRFDSPSGRRVMYSLSGNLLCSSRRRDRSRDLRDRRWEFSASGRMLGKAGLPPPASDSTMEELQGAIQAAIAHCKNSIASDQQQSRQDTEAPWEMAPGFACSKLTGI